MVGFGFKSSDELLNEWLNSKKNKSKFIVKVLKNAQQLELNENSKQKEKIKVIIDG